MFLIIFIGTKSLLSKQFIHFEIVYFSILEGTDYLVRIR